MKLRIIAMLWTIGTLLAIPILIMVASTTSLSGLDALGGYLVCGPLTAFLLWIIEGVFGEHGSHNQNF